MTRCLPLSLYEPGSPWSSICRGTEVGRRELYFEVEGIFLQLMGLRWHDTLLVLWTSLGSRSRPFRNGPQLRRGDSRLRPVEVNKSQQTPTGKTLSPQLINVISENPDVTSSIKNRSGDLFFLYKWGGSLTLSNTSLRYHRFYMCTLTYLMTLQLGGGNPSSRTQ